MTFGSLPVNCINTFPGVYVPELEITVEGATDYSGSVKLQASDSILMTTQCPHAGTFIIPDLWKRKLPFKCFS